jgi:DNA-directed RNA polymerase subunit RPC12/RpoP
MFAEVDLDASGVYQDHRITQAGYICLNCGSPAVDLGEVPAAMDEEAQDDFAPMPVDLLCPHCETLVSVLPDSDCPNCGASLEVVRPE